MAIRMHRKLGCSLIAAGLLCLLAALPPATGAQIAAPNPRHLTCSASPGQFRSRLFERLPDPNRIEGRIRLREAEQHPNWLSAAGLLFGTPGRYPVGIMLSVYPRDPDNLVIIVRLPDGRSNAVGRIPADAWANVSVELVGNDLMEVSVGRFRQSIRIGPERPQLAYMMCSTGSYDFEFGADTIPSERPYRLQELSDRP